MLEKAMVTEHKDRKTLGHKALRMQTPFAVAIVPLGVYCNKMLHGAEMNL